MTQFNLSGLKKILNPSSGKRNVVDQITDRLSKSSIGLSSGDDILLLLAYWCQVKYFSFSPSF